MTNSKMFPTFQTHLTYIYKMSYAEQEQDAREYAELKAQHEAERREERLASQSTLAVKGYIIEEGFSGKAHYYDFQYKVNYSTEKFVRFTNIEQKLQFIDLLHEAGYRYDEEYEGYIVSPPPGGTVRP